MILELVSAFALIFVAEMGDKTQLIAMSFATKYKLKHVIIGILIGSFFNHAIAITLGFQMQQALPLDVIGLLAGFLFIVFSLWNLKEENEENENSFKYGPVITVALAFFIGELGDKTQLTAFILSSESTYPFVTLIGTTLGMGVTGLIGILLGIKLGKKVPEVYIKIVSSVVFLIFGTVKVLNNIDLINQATLVLIITFAIYIILFGYLVNGLYKSHKGEQISVYLKQAETLKKIYDELSKKVEDICLTCNVCQDTECLLGYTKKIIKDASLDKEIKYQDDIPIDLKVYDKDKVLLAYKLVVKAQANHPNNDVLEQLKQNFKSMINNNL